MQQKIWSREEFLDLLDDQDVAALWERWKLVPADVKRRDDAAFLAAVGTRSTTTLVQEVLALRTATLQMLGDVLAFLTEQSSAVRTTGSILVLDEEVAIAPQKVEAALKWSAHALQRQSPETWEALRERFKDEIEPLFEKIHRFGEVDFSRRSEDLMDVAIRSMTGGSSRVRKIVTVEFDEEGFRLREEYVERLSELSEQLQGLEKNSPSKAAAWLVGDVEELTRLEQQGLEESHYYIQRANHVINPTGYNDITDEDHETWKRFVEDILFLSDVEPSTSVVDVLRLDLFRKRPQLYELWIVVVFITFLRRCGHDLELLTMATTSDGRLQWNLNYAKSKLPVAKFVNRRDGTTFFLFYQLFRRGTRRDDMPDIALLPSEHPDDRPIWIADPKHSERHGYSLRDYETVARQYHDTFHPQRTWIIEYYPRNDLVFDKGVQLITDVAPGRPGLAKLMAQLNEVHGMAAETMVVIDVSSSFEHKLEKVRVDIAARLTAGEGFSDEAIWFSDDAIVWSGIVDAVRNGMLALPPAISSGGTRFSPVVDLLKRLRAEGSVPPTLRIYTDGGFADVAMERALAEISTFAVVEVVDCD